MIQQICFSIYHSSHVKMEAEIQFTRNLGSRVWSKNKSSKKNYYKTLKKLKYDKRVIWVPRSFAPPQGGSELKS